MPLKNEFPPIILGEAFQEALEIAGGRTMKLATREHLQLMAYWRDDILRQLKAIANDMNDHIEALGTQFYNIGVSNTRDKLIARHAELLESLKHEGVIDE